MRKLQRARERAMAEMEQEDAERGHREFLP